MTDTVVAVALAARALDGLSMRMEAIAQNVANANSPTYRPVRVEFEQALRDAAGHGLDAVRQVQFSYVAGAPLQIGDDRRSDLELIDAGTTASRYALVADAVGRRLSLMRAAAGSSQ